MITGKVLRRHAGGYLVQTTETNTILLCPLRARLKKEGVSVVTGDDVEVSEVELGQVSGAQGSGVITARLTRRNLLTRPYLANLDQVFIVQSIRQPEWNPLLSDRYLVNVQLELDAVRSFICINKCDLAEEDELEALRKIYKPLDYEVLFVSAKTGRGIEDLRQHLGKQSSMFIGPSGVGKSSLINLLIPDLNLKVDLNEELQVGRHTTTYCELYKVPDKQNPSSDSGWIADTPGFNIGELSHPEPKDVAWQFPELIPLAQECKFSNCLHIVEDGCHVLANLSKIAPSRYESYAVIVADAQNAAAAYKETSQKIDGGSKKVGGGSTGKSRVIPRLNERFRTNSRRKEKQNLNDYRRSNSIDSDEESELDSTDTEQ
ncbi:MAG: ribosome small subunit-dependent GTPase A [Candidatus Obscuribacterales bacterium]|nr:ribosome small subunit-dependent GTPase A [Candidatus Obscuribacterales bacterium]